MGQMPKLLGMVEAVADDEVVVDLESEILDRHLRLSTGRFTEQAGGAQVARGASTYDVLEVLERPAGVDDVFDDQDGAACDVAVEILEQLNLAG